MDFKYIEINCILKTKNMNDIDFSKCIYYRNVILRHKSEQSEYLKYYFVKIMMQINEEI